MRLSAIWSIAALAAIAWGGELVYVQSQRADLRSEPVASAKAVGAVERGAQLEVLQAQGSWLKVKAKSAEGWLSRLVTGARPPLDRVSITGGETVDAARRRASALTTAGATRGLAAEDRARVGEVVGADYDALNKLESVVLSEQQINEFWRSRGVK